MATIDEVFASMPEGSGYATNEALFINADTRQINIPGNELIFGVEADAGAERKYFMCPRIVGDNLDIAGSFVRVNFRNANGEMDSYLVDDVTADSDFVTFSWLVSSKVVRYKGQVTFVICVVGPDLKVKWHTAHGMGVVLEGLEPDAAVEVETADVIAQLITMVEAQTATVENVGAEQREAVRQAAEDAEAAAVAEIEAKGVNTRESIPDDYTALCEAVDALERIAAPGIVCEVEGESVVVSDASNNRIQGLRIFGHSTQDGTPTPDAPVDIVSVEKPTVTVCGKNIFDVSAITTNGSVVNNGNGTITVTKVVSQPSQKFAELCPSLCPGDVATFSFVSPATDGTNQFDYIYLVGAKESWKSGATKTITREMLDGPIYFYASKDGNGAGVATTISNVQVELGDTATDYEPYSGQTVSTTHTLPGIPVTSGGNYTDSEGQRWVCDEVDLERGVYIKRIGTMVLTGGESWSLNAQASEVGINAYHFIKNGDSMLHSRGYCTHFRNGGPWSTGLSSVTNTFWVANDQVAVFKTDGTTSLIDFKNEIRAAHAGGNPVILYYVSQSPIETPLSETEIAAYRALRTNKPNTTIFNDRSAHMAVAYVADTKLYIDNKIAALTV